MTLAAPMVTRTEPGAGFRARHEGHQITEATGDHAGFRMLELECLDCAGASHLVPLGLAKNALA